jgi:N-acetylmuramoyl-L-alanine amidase
MPAVLLELGFINHRTDRSKITTSEFQIEAAKAVIRGLKVFFGNGQSNR